MKLRLRRGVLFGGLLAIAAIVVGNPFPPLWGGGNGPAVHHQPVAWPSEPADPAHCGDSCGEWKPYTRFRRSINDPRVQDPSNGGTAPQNYVNVSSSCTDKAKPSIYYYLHQDPFDAAKDVLMFRWRVEQPAHNYATGPSAGAYGSSNPWSSALWTVLFDIDGSGYRSLAAHLNGSSGSPSEAIDILAGIWGETPVQSLDYIGDAKVHLLGHNPTAVVGNSGRILNFQGSLTPTETWPNGAGETSWDYGTTRAKRVSSSPCTEYFIDYQIPVAMLDASGVGGPKITRDKPISMLFCTANSLNNPFQKDCAINRTWNATATSAAPFGDYLSFNKEDAYQQPIVSSVTAQAPTSCPATHKLTAKVQDALALRDGVVVPSVKAVDFYYWRDSDGDGAAGAGDTGSAWTRITPTAALQARTLNTWTADWSAGSLPKGRYLIGVQAVDDAAAVDDGMAAAAADNRTFSYFSGDANNEIYIAGAWKAGQQAQFMTHSPAQSPATAEDWYGNPSATGNQVAVIGTALNTCGVAPALTLAAAPGTVAAGATVAFTATLANPAANSSAVSMDALEVALPPGFAYVGGSSGGATTSDPAIAGQQLTWTFGSPVSVGIGSTATLQFAATAASVAGAYNAVASTTTAFGAQTSSPASVVVDAARVSLSSSPSTYSIAANGSTPLTFTLRYANDSAVAVANASIAAGVPAGATFVSCAGASCSESAGTVTFTIGSLSAGAGGSVTFVITVPNSWSTPSLTSSSTLSAIAPDSSTLDATASSTVAVTGLAGATAPALRLTKTASAATIAPGGNVTYTLSYENYGTGAASSVVLTDTLPSGLTYQSCSDSCSHNNGVVTWNIGSVAAGVSGTRTITIVAANPFTAANPSVNDASITWSGGTPVTAAATVGVTGQACSTYYFSNATGNVGSDGTRRLASVSPVPVPSDTGTTVTSTAPVSGAAFLEVLRVYQDPQTQNDVPFNGNITTNMYIDRANGQGLNIRATVYDYDSTTGGRTQLAQNTTLFNGSTKGLLSFAVTPSGTLAKGHRLLWVYEARSAHNSQTVQVQLQFGGTVANGISGGTTFANSNAQYCVTPPASLTLNNTVDTASIVENTTPTLTYTLRYANAGSAQATNLSLVGALPAGFGNCQYSTDGSSWNACSAPTSHTFSIAALAGGSSGAAYVRGSVPANTTGPSTLTGAATLVSDQTVQISASAATSVAGVANAGAPALSLDLAANRSVAQPGQSVIYTATVVNVGDGAASNVVVSNALPATAYYTYAGCTGSCVNAAGTLTWPTIATLAAGASQSYTYTMATGTSGVPAGVTVINDTVGASGGGGLTAVSNSASVSLNGNPALTPSFVAAPANAVQPGDSVNYTFAVVNSGAADATGVTVAASIPPHTTFVSSLTGTFDPLGNQVMFGLGTVSSGGSDSVEFVVRVDSPLDSGTTALISTASMSAQNAAQQSLSATALATAEPVLFVANDAPVSVPLPSAVLTAAAGGTTLFVDRTDRFALGQLVSVGGDVAAIVAIGSRTLTVDSSVNASIGTAVLGSFALTVSYRNDGNAPATGVTAREALPAGLVYYSAEPNAQSTPIVGNSGDVEWSLDTVNAGSGGLLRVIAFPSGATGAFTSTATLSAANGATRTDDAVTAIGGLSVTKSTTTPVLSAGGEADYTIVIANSLASGALVDVRDVLPEGFSYQDGSAIVGGNSLDPVFDADDDAHARPLWSDVPAPAAGSITITFKANVGASVGAAAYQNELQVDASPSVAVLGFDALSTTQEDVTVLAANEGVLRGRVFRRYGAGTGAFDANTDLPLSGVRVEVHKSVYDCITGADCYVAYTDGAGAFARVVEAGDWIVSVVAGSGDLDAAWTQSVGTANDIATVPAGGSVADDNGYRNVGAMHLVSATADVGGSISPGSETVEEGETAEFIVTPATGYEVDTVTGCGGALNGATFRTGPVTGACTVQATFKLLSYAVTAGAGAGGSITPPSAMVNHGSTTSFTVTPSTGFEIAGVSGCSGSLSGNIYTTGAVTSACAVSATFALRSYTVSATAGAGGSITPPSSSVNHGSTATFTVTPAAGHAIATVTGCGGTLTGASYTTQPITSACSVNASFTANAHTVTASAGAGGSISPPSTTVTHGSRATFTVTPAAGHSIASVSGCGGALSGSSYATDSITAACSVIATFSSIGPSISAPPPARINARSLFTIVPQSLAPSATDGAGAPLPVTLVGGPLQLTPGRHTITWRAEDALARVVTVDQQLDIWPTVSLSADLVLDFGASASFDVLLNGAAPLYPYSVSFTVDDAAGVGTYHTLASGFVTFESGTETSVSFDSLPQPGSLPDRVLKVTLDSAENIGDRGELNVRLRSANLAPHVSIVASQADRTGTLIARNGGIVTLHAVVADPNAADAHTLQWKHPPPALVDISSDGFELSFDPAQLTAGLLSFGVTVTDNGNPPLGAVTAAMLALREAAPALGSGDANGNGIADSVEGWTDAGNGIPAYLYRLTARNVLPENAPITDKYLIESESGIRLRVGAAAQLDGDGGARLGSATVPRAIPTDTIENVGGYFSFEAHELPSVGAKVRFVIPQRAPIPSQPSYRLWDSDSGRWVSFIESANDVLESAPGQPGICPSADSGLYTPGLTPGHLCVRITVEDGGVNDLDRSLNKSITSTGGVAGRPEVIVTGTSSGSGGGGAMNVVSILTLGFLAALRRRGKWMQIAAATVLLPLAASAQESGADERVVRGGWLVGADALFVRGSVGENEMDARIARQGYEVDTQLSGQSRAGGSLFAAYRRERFGIEAAYVDLGELTTRVRGTEPLTDDYLLAISRSHPQSGSGPQLSVLGFLPLGEQLELTGRIGGFYWRSNMSAEARASRQHVSDRSLDALLGLGLSYRWSERWSFGAQWLEYRLAGERISSLSLGVRYRLRAFSAACPGTCTDP